MHAKNWLPLLLIVAGCAGGDEPSDDTDTDTDAEEPVDTDTDPGADTAEPIDSDDTETDPVETEDPTIRIKGQLWCIPPADTDAPVDTAAIPFPGGETGDPTPASPGWVEVTLVQPWFCRPIAGCDKTEGYEVLARADVDEEGRFELEIQLGGYTVEELYLHTDNPVHTCGSGYHFTQWPLTDYEDWENIVIDVDSVFY